MFCKNCGNMIQSHAKFCQKCGAAVSRSAAGRKEGASASQDKGGRRDRQPALSRRMLWVAVGGAAALLLAAAVICFGALGRTGKPTDKESQAGEDTAREERRQDEQKEEQDRSITVLDVSSAVVLEGAYKNLRSITMSPGADGAVEPITYREGASFPALESLECGAVFKASDSGERGYLDEKDFPRLKNVTMKMVNKYIDEDIMMTYLIFEGMYREGRLQSFDMKNIYTVEDLYGTWTDGRQMLSLTFERDGTLRVADANNLFGVDVLKYQEGGEGTLRLSADQPGFLGLISINMKYELFGDRLWVELSGQRFELARQVSQYK